MIKDKRYERPEKSEHWNGERFLAELKYSSEKISIEKSKLPKTINFKDSVIGERIKLLREKTEQDPRKREHSIVAKLGAHNEKKGKIIIPKKLTVGEETHVATSVPIREVRDLINPQYTTREKILFTMHSHGVADVPPSPTDFSNILSLDNKSEEAFFVTTPTSNFLIMRTLESPDNMSEEEIKIWVKDKTKQILAEQKASAEFSLRESDHMRNSIRSNMSFVLDTCRENNLAIYTSLAEDPTNFIHISA